MKTPALSKSQEVRARFSHPVIDADGHFLELPPIFEDYIKEVGGADLHARYVKEARRGHSLGNSYPTGVQPLRSEPWRPATAEERRRVRAHQVHWWGLPADTRTRATCELPDLYYKRMDSLGIDFMIAYPTWGLMASRFPSEEIRACLYRAVNRMAADLFRSYADRITPVAVIPMHTPQDASRELEHCVRELRSRIVAIEGWVPRPFPAARDVAGLDGALAPRYLDSYGLDSDHDYDPFWALCAELEVPLASHQFGYGLPTHKSPSNFVFNHLNHFATAQNVVCRSLFLGGVLRRFPTLRFGLMEAGVGWAINLLHDLVCHWEKRGGKAMKRLNPAHIDVEAYMALAAEHGGPAIEGRLDDVRLYIEGLVRDNGLHPVEADLPPERDDFHRCQIEEPRDIAAQFSHFYFGCEPDDRSVPSAFQAGSGLDGKRLNAMFGSDIGHYDVQDITATVSEAYELVEHELITEGDFRDFVFGNAARYCSINPAFFKGTRVEADVQKFLAEEAG